MKLDKEALRRIIKEELESFLDESRLLDKYKKGKEAELKKYIRSQSRQDPDQVIAALGPDSAEMIGKTVVADYPTRMPMTRDMRIQSAAREMSTSFGGIEDFYSLDSSGTSAFSRVLELLPELEQISAVNAALKSAGGDPKKVTVDTLRAANQGSRTAYIKIRRKTRQLFDSIPHPLENYRQ
jgi:hypothetical protein